MRQGQDYFVGAKHSFPRFRFRATNSATISNGLTFSIHKQYVLDEPFKVGLSCVQSADELHLELHYDANLYQRADIARLAEEFQTLVSSAVVNPDATLGRIANRRRRRTTNRRQLQRHRRRLSHRPSRSRTVRSAS